MNGHHKLWLTASFVGLVCSGAAAQSLPKASVAINSGQFGGAVRRLLGPGGGFLGVGESATRAADFDGARPASSRKLLEALSSMDEPPVISDSVEVRSTQWHDDNQRHRDRGSSWDWSTVKRLAHDVSRRSKHVHEEAEHKAHHGDYWEDRALEDLHRLAKKAEHFHRQVEQWNQDPSHTRSDYHDLKTAYDRAAYSFQSAHAFQHVRQDFYAVRRLLSDLEYYYRGSSGHDEDQGHGRSRRHRRDWPW